MAKGWIWGQEQVCQRLKGSSGKRPGRGKGGLDGLING